VGYEFKVVPDDCEKIGREQIVNSPLIPDRLGEPGDQLRWSGPKGVTLAVWVVAFIDGLYIDTPRQAFYDSRPVPTGKRKQT
jgi:hypothetical protein